MEMRWGMDAADNLAADNWPWKNRKNKKAHWPNYLIFIFFAFTFIFLLQNFLPSSFLGFFALVICSLPSCSFLALIAGFALASFYPVLRESTQQWLWLWLPWVLGLTWKLMKILCLVELWSGAPFGLPPSLCWFCIRDGKPFWFFLHKASCLCCISNLCFLKAGLLVCLMQLLLYPIWILMSSLNHEN